MKKHNFLEKIIILYLSMLFTLFVFESILRFFYPQITHRSEGLYINDKKLCFRHKPHFSGYEISPEFNVPIKINSKGLRDREVAYEKDDATFRVLVLGDSFTYGSGVTDIETFPKVLEASLNSIVKAEVINAGVSAYGTYHEMTFFQTEGYRYHPDLIILAFHPNNDIFDNLGPFKNEVRGGFLVLKSENQNEYIEKIKMFFRRHSHLYRSVGDKYHLLKIHLQKSDEMSYTFEIYKKDSPVHIERAWMKTFEYVQEIKRLAEKIGADFIVVNVPKLFQADFKVWEHYIKNKENFDIDRPTKFISEFCAKNEIFFIDLVEQFRKLENPSSYYWVINRHWNTKGHFFAAKVIFEKIKNSDLLNKIKYARNER